MQEFVKDIFPDFHPELKGVIIFYHLFGLIMIILFKILTQECFALLSGFLIFSEILFHYQRLVIYGLRLIECLPSQVSLTM